MITVHSYIYILYIHCACYGTREPTLYLASNTNVPVAVVASPSIRWLQKSKALKIKKKPFVCVCVLLKSHHTDGIKAGVHAHSQNKSLDLLICDEPILRLGVQFESPLTEVADEGAGQQSHAGDGQQLQQPLPGEQVVQR